MAQPLLAVLLLPEPTWPLLQHGGSIIVTIRSKVSWGSWAKGQLSPTLWSTRWKNINFTKKTGSVGVIFLRVHLNI